MSDVGPGAPSARRRTLLLPMVVGSVLNPINTSVIAVALVPIGVAFGAPATETAWLITALFLATTVGQPLAGRLVDTYGPRRLFLIGAGLTATAGVVGMTAPNIWVLVFARVILGLGTSAAYPASIAVLADESRRTGVPTAASALTALAVAGQTVAVIGPTFGGLLVDHGGWQATLALNVPLGLACLVLGWVFLPRDTHSSERVGRSLDMTGIALFAVTMVSLLLFVNAIEASTVWLSVLAIAAGVAFVIRELRAKDAFIDLRVLSSSRPLVLVFIRAILGATVTYGFVFGFTQWLESERALSASVAGLVLLPSFASGLVASVITGRSPQYEAKLRVAGVLQLIGCVLLMFVAADTPLWVLIGISAFMGVPQGLSNLGLQSALYLHAPQAAVGASAGLLRAFLYLGAIAASTVGGAALAPSTGGAGIRILASVMLGSAVLFAASLMIERRSGRRTP
jgi:MFS family permease